MNVEIILSLGVKKRLYQLGDDFQVFGQARDIKTASGGTPAVVNMVNTDNPDVWFTRDWQFFLVGINFGMEIPPINALMGDGKAYMNGTGSDNRNNWLTGKTDRGKDPATDRFRSNCLSTHECIVDGDYLIPIAMDGSVSPPLKPGRSYPRTLAEIDPDIYAIHPRTHPELFVVCNNVRWKMDPKRLAYGPFDKGIVPEWMPAWSRPYTYFPFVTRRYKNLRTPKSWWTGVDEIQPPYRS